MAHEHTQVMDRIRCPVGAGGAADSEAQTHNGAQVQETAGRWPKTHGTPARIRGDCVCSSHWLPMESITERIRKREFRAPVLPGMEATWRVCENVAAGLGGIRRVGGHSLGLAKHRRHDGEGAAGLGSRWTESDRPGEKKEPSAACS